LLLSLLYYASVISLLLLFYHKTPTIARVQYDNTIIATMSSCPPELS